MAKNEKSRNYRMDYTTMTLTMTAEFAENAYDPFTQEYEILTRLRKDFPNLRIVRKTHRKSKTPNSAKGMTYDRMEKYIRLHDNADELMELFQKVKDADRGYLYVFRWFKKQFPNYKSIPEFKDGKLYVVPVEAPVEDESAEADPKVA